MLFFYTLTLFILFCFLDDYAISCLFLLFWSCLFMQKLLLILRCSLYKSSASSHYGILSSCLAYLQACSGGENGRGGRSGKLKTLRRKSSARNENNDKYT